MPLLGLLLVFILVPVAELYVIIEVLAEAIGPVPTIVLLILDSVLGMLLLRWQGRTVWRRFLDAVRTGHVPHREILDGMLVILGGALLITPGFLTDAVGLALLVPPSRALARRALDGWLRRRAVAGFAEATARGGGRAARRHDVEGTATEAPGDGAGPEARRLER